MVFMFWNSAFIKLPIVLLFFQYYPNYDQPDSDWGKITALVDSHNNYDLIGFKLVFLGTDNILGDERPVNVRNLKVEVCLGML